MEGNGIRHHALDYLKGKDVPLMGMWTREIFEEFGEIEPDGDSLLNPPETNEDFIAAGKEFLQQLKDKATSVEEVKVTDVPPTTA